MSIAMVLKNVDILSTIEIVLVVKNMITILADKKILAERWREWSDF